MSYNVGIVGCGYIGKKRAAVAASHPRTKLKMVADIDLAQGHEISLRYGCECVADWRQLIDSDNIDIVIVATPNDQLAPIALAALRQGKHVLCEKPMARTAEEARPLVQAAASSFLKVGFSLRYHPAIARAYQVSGEGSIGRLIFARCCYGHGGRPGYESEWRWQKDISGGGELLDQGVHVADLFSWFMGDFSEVFGYNTQGYWRSDGVEDNAFAVFKTDSGQAASLHVSCTQWKNLFSFEVFGDKGYIKVDGLGGSYGQERITVGFGAGTGKPPDEQVAVFEDGEVCWTKEWDEFVGDITTGKRPSGNGNDALKALELIDAIYLSSQSGRVIPLSTRGSS